MPAAPAPSKPARPRPRARLRRAAKWGGLAACVLLAALFVVSLRWTVMWFWLGVSGPDMCVCSVSLGGGSFGYLFSSNVTHWPSPQANDPPTTKAVWELARTAEYNPWRLRVTWDTRFQQVHMPFWAPLLLLGIPTLILFHHDRPSARRRRAGQCVKCGYDRAGLAPGTLCPECGGAAAAL